MNQNKIADLQEAMARILDQDYPCQDYIDEEDPRKKNRMIIDMYFFLSSCLRVLPANSPHLMRAQIALDNLSKYMLAKNTFIQTFGFVDRITSVIDYDAPWKFIDVGEMVVHINRLSDDLPLDELLMTGLLFNVFVSSKPQLTPPQYYTRLTQSTQDLFNRCMMRPEGLPYHRDMEMDVNGLKVKEWILNEFKLIDNDLVDRTDGEWIRIAINKANVIFSAACLVYVRRASAYDYVKNVARGIHPEMLYHIEGVV